MNQNLTQARALSAASALVELLTAHPELPLAVWTIDGSHNLKGTYDGPALRVMADYAKALGGTPFPPSWQPRSGRVAQVLVASWRHVETTVIVYAGLSEFPELVQRVEQSLLRRQISEHGDPCDWCAETRAAYQRELQQVRLAVAA